MTPTDATRREEGHSPTPPAPPTPFSASSLNYRLLIILSLLAITLTLLRKDYGIFALLPAMPGLLSLVLFSVTGPVFTLVFLTILLTLGHFILKDPLLPPISSSETSDFVLAAVCLVYVGAHWRLHSLIKQAVPGDPRRAKKPARRRLERRWFLPVGDPTRTPNRVSDMEWFFLILQGILFALTGYLLESRLQLEGIVPSKSPDVGWRLLLLVWAVLLALLGGRVVFAITRWYLAVPDECQLYLQDQLWDATRGEQRRIDAWLTAGRLNQKDNNRGT